MLASAQTSNSKLPQINHKLTVQSQNFADDSCAIRSLDWDRSRFDIELGLRNGTTYNSFIIKGEKLAIIDTSHAKFEELWFEELLKEVNPQEVDYLITSHTEPDHSGLIGNLLELNKNITVVGSKLALKFIEDQIHVPFKRLEVKSGEFLNLGTNPNSGVQHNIEFISAPNLHWPDTIFSYDHSTMFFIHVMHLGSIIVLRNFLTLIKKKYMMIFVFITIALWVQTLEAFCRQLKE